MSPLRKRRGPRRRRVHPAVISLVAILATAAVVFYAFNQGLPFVHGFIGHAMVTNSVNVRQDSPVRIAGIDVGTVTGVSPAGQATEINFTVNDTGLPLHTDATLRIRDRLFLEGGYYLELDPGSPSAPIAHDGFTIPLAQTATPVQFYSVLSTFNAAARSSLEHLLSTLNEGFSPEAGRPASASGAGGLKVAIPELTPVLEDVAWVSRGLRGSQPGDVERLLGSAAQVTGTLAANEGQLTGLVHDLNLTSGALAASDGALGQTISGIDQTLQVAPGPLTAIDRSLPPLLSLSDALDPSLKVAPPIITTVTASVDQLAQVVAPVERSRLLRALNTTFTQFPEILRLLARAFPVTKPVTDCLRTHVTPLLRSTVPDGKLSTGLPVWQDFVHFLPSFAGASGNFDANGHYTRVLLGAGTNSVAGTMLSNLPGIGQLVGEAPGGNKLTGVSPGWVGDLSSADFHPEAPCAQQKLPSLAPLRAALDLVSRHTPAARDIGLQGLRQLVSRAQAAVTPSSSGAR